MSSHAEQYTRYQVANAQMRSHPYPHFLVRDIFDADTYRAMLEHLLPPELMQPIKQVRPVGKGYSDDRYVFTLAPEELDGLPAGHGEFWRGLSAWLLGVPFLSTLLNKFADDLKLRFGNDNPRIYKEAMLVDDRTRYSLGPHSDSPAKVITLLFYLPADDSRPHLGTSIYVPRDPAFRCPGGPHHPFKYFERVMTMPYLPNTLFAFFKTDNSFHGVEPIREGDYRRHLLFYDVKCDLESLSQESAAAEPAAAGKPKVEFSF